MAAKKGGLGKGLDSLLVNKVNKTEAAEKSATASTTTTTKKKSTKKETPDSMVNKWNVRYCGWYGNKYSSA